MKYFVTLLLSFAFFMSYGQYGISVSYDQLQIDQNSNLTTEQNLKIIPTSSLSVAANYWFRLKNKRIEFFPEVSYRKSETNRIIETQLNRASIGLNFNSSIYPFDLDGDCDCPVFSKQNDFFKKGFFLELSPGIHYQMNQIKGESIVAFQQSEGPLLLSESRDNQLNYKIGFGAGLDIGISDLVTITPFFRYDIHFGDQWALLNSVNGRNISTKPSSTQNFMRFGVRTSLRPDYKRRYRR